ncbi:outer membrane putative beta-barrel porin/alpha-amylase [Winogradskyella wandonensis]|uniref:Outer membrane putative beta-barrel porin/alpha-amylase n=1 Tax=Winogradskyella wandonensis TaxID=1442586 RepID=A0A4R1KRN7_9FLAO|nr:transporter [Winogradskyella wandonensis]TCK67705.1 outer membrane putative beta-barrel porin/alpha-amylase [Winogradskyella wandonensis]
MKLTKHIVQGLIVIFTIQSFSQEQEDRFSNPLVTDRPDATEASSTVGKGVLQFETGGLYESFEANNIKNETYTFNTMLIRYGLLDNLELRLGWDFVEGVTSVNGNKLDNVTSGLSPLLLGLKLDIAEENGAMPEIALIGHVFPVFSAGADYRPETTGVDFRLSLSHTLNEKSSLGYNIGAQWGDDSPEASAIYTLAYGYSFSDKWGMYAEVYGDFPEDSKANHYWDAGFTYLANYDLQFDVYFGTSFTEGQDLLLGAGLSYRIKPKQ